MMLPNLPSRELHRHLVAYRIGMNFCHPAPNLREWSPDPQPSATGEWYQREQVDAAVAELVADRDRLRAALDRTLLDAAMTLTVRPCQRCEVEGRCAAGHLVYWSTTGPHGGPCPCGCHRRKP